MQPRIYLTIPLCSVFSLGGVAGLDLFPAPGWYAGGLVAFHLPSWGKMASL
jgi:hypothetical protein